MNDEERQQFEHAIAQRGDDTAAIVLFTRDGTGVAKAAIAFMSLDELEGNGEHEVVQQLSGDIGDDLRAVCVFRWPIGTSDATVLSNISLEYDAVLKTVYQPDVPRLAIPYRYCWGEPEGAEDEQFVQQLAPRLAHCREQVEMQWEKRLPSCFLVSISQSQGVIEFGLSLNVTPFHLIALTDDDYQFQAIDKMVAEHEREYSVAPKAIALVRFFDRKGVREMAGTMSKVIRTVNKWSRPYEDYGQMCYWMFE